MDKHTIFEKYINNLVLSIYGNDPNASYEDMDTGTAFDIDGVAIFVSDKLVTSIEDVDLILEDIKNKYKFFLYPIKNYYIIINNKIFQIFLKQ